MNPSPGPLPFPRPAGGGRVCLPSPRAFINFHMRIRLRLNLVRACVAALFVLFNLCAARAQTPAAPKADAPAQAKPVEDEKALAIIARAVEALGGRAYSDVKTTVSGGYYTEFRDGVGGLPTRFQDYTVFPDRERVEFSGAGGKSVQVNVGEAGWVADLKTKKLTDLTPQAIESFRLTIRTSLDGFLRGWWRREGASVTYIGRREAGLARRNEAVRLKYPDGLEVEFEFDAKDGLPSKAKYRRQTSEGDSVEEEDRYAQFQTIGAVKTPFIIDHYRAGQQSSRVNYDEVEFNRAVPDSLFTKPDDIKKVKMTL
jgi:hypothetical protein